MKKAFHSIANPLKQRSLFVGTASFAIVAALLVGMVFAPPVSAAETDTGYDTKNTTVYSAVDAVTSSGIAESNKNSRWKFAVDAENAADVDFFDVTTNDFALDAKAVDGGIEISWTAPEGAEGDAEIRISDGAAYNKKLNISGSSCIINDIAIGSTYEIQAVIGEYASELLSYANTMIPVTVTGASGNSADFANDAVYSRFLIDLGDAKRYVSDKAGILIKLDMSFLEDKEVYFNYAAEDGAYAGKTYSSNDAWVQFSSNLNAVDIDESGDWTDINNSTANTVDGANNAFIIDETSGIYQAVNNGANNKAITHGDMNFTYSGSKQYIDEKSTGFRSGYLLIPFDHYNADTIAQIASNGNIVYITENYYYMYWTRSNSTASAEDRNPHNVMVSDLVEGYVIENNGTNSMVRAIFDRNISVSSVTLITDYAGFVGTNIDTDNKNFSAEPPKYESNVSDGSYMTSVGNVLSSANSATTGEYSNYNSGYSFTVAAEDTVKIGFTAPSDGYYEISDLLSAGTDAGAYYRVVLETEDGDRTLLQETRDISAGDGKLVLLTKLSAGNTVYIEAWADTADAEINFGLPKAVKINNMTDGSYVSDPMDYYVTSNNDSISYSSGERTAHPMAWAYKWFLNPVSVTDSTGTTVYTEDTYWEGNGLIPRDNTGAIDAASVNYDTLGIGQLEAGSDGTRLINALKEYEYFFAGNEQALMARVSTISGFKNGEVQYAYGPRNHLSNGFMSLNNGTSSPGNVSSKDAKYLQYGFGYKNGLSNNSSYYWFNLGVAFEWTAPAAGTVDLSGMERIKWAHGNAYQIILVNNDVSAVLVNDITTPIDAVNVEKGDVVTIAYATIDGSYVNSRLHVHSITFTPNVSNITIKGDTVATEMVGGLIANGTEIEFPYYEKQGTVFYYWKAASDEGAEYLEGDTYTVNGDDTLTPVFSYYGDLNGDGEINAVDLSLLKKHLMGSEIITDETVLELMDTNLDGEHNILDLIRIKKYLSGYSGVLGS